MASARIVQPKPVVPPQTVTLELNEDEAHYLGSLLGWHVSPGQHEKVNDSIWNALFRIGFGGHNLAAADGKNSVWFS